MLESPSRRRHTMTVLGLLGVIVVDGLFAAPSRSHAQAPSTAPSTELAGLRQQRIETLRQASDVAHRMFAQGMSTAGEVFRIDRSLLDAQLESAASIDERVKLLQNALEIAKQQEDLALRQHKAGLTAPLAPLEARAERLRIAVRLIELTAK